MIPRNIRNRIVYLLWQSDMEMTRFALAIGAVIISILLSWPGQLFGPDRTTYLLMAQIMREGMWACLFMLQGCAMIYSLLWGFKSKIFYIVDAVLGCALWSAMVIACFASHYIYSKGGYQPPAAMGYDIVGMFLSFWHLVRYSYGEQK
mgnify:CR=1 FL=1